MLSPKTPPAVLRALLQAADEMALPLTLRQVEELANRAAAAYGPPLPRLTSQDFTGQQWAVLQAMGRNESVLQTAARMHISQATVRVHRRVVLHRLGASSPGEAVGIARACGLLRALEQAPRPGTRTA